MATRARRTTLGLTAREYGSLARLTTPEKIQAFINAIPINHEPDGPTVYSVREVLRRRRAHCIEGAFVAACALWMHGDPPLVMHMGCDERDDPHVVALFRRRGAWGAISKSNGAWLRYRDPIYRSLRELALSYFHEYFDRRGRKTLRSYSGAFDLRRLDPAAWITSLDSCAVVDDLLRDLRHYRLLTGAQARAITPRDPFQRTAAALVQYPRVQRAPRKTQFARPAAADAD
jgi:hypothetical protein